MNRLFIMGNGFDLAHGLPTSYQSFIDWYLLESTKEFATSGNYEDPLMSIYFRYGGNSPLGLDKVDYGTGFYWLKTLTQHNRITVGFNSTILENTLEKIEKYNWVDIEEEYFQLLSLQKTNPEEVINLNSELVFLKSKLIEYINSIDIKVSNSNSDLLDILFERINEEELLLPHEKEGDVAINYHFLNFNYTNTLQENYAIHSYVERAEINFIHGNNQDNIVFGYGDEKDEKFKAFEEIKNNDLFKHVKSFDYLKSSNYSKVTKFIDADYFQGYILGHSCGLSDRTLLSQIFEHEKCVSIKLFYHQKEDGSNNFTDLTYDLSRHFSDKVLMRKKVVTFDLCAPLPQCIEAVSYTHLTLPTTPYV